MRLQVEYTQAAVTEENSVTWRVTIREYSFADYAHYLELLAAGGKWFEEISGKSISGELTETVDTQRRNMIFYRAKLLASIERRATKDGFEYLGERKRGAGEWEKVPLPEGWTGISAMQEAIPYAFYEQWLDACDRLNNTVYPYNETDFFEKRTKVNAIE